MTASLPVIDIHFDSFIGNNRAIISNYKIGLNRETTSNSLITRMGNNRLVSAKNIVVFHKLTDFAEVKNNWDNNNAIAPDQSTINAAKRFAEDIDKVGIDIFYCTYGQNGEILIELKKDNKAIEFYFYPKGIQDYAAFDENNDLEREAALTKDEFRKVIQWFNFGKWI